jgi:hypothetical protein
MVTNNQEMNNICTSPVNMCPRWDLNPHCAGFKPGVSADWTTGTRRSPLSGVTLSTREFLIASESTAKVHSVAA